MEILSLKMEKRSQHLCVGEGNGNPLQCSCLENPRDGGAWWAVVDGVPESKEPALLNTPHLRVRPVEETLPWLWGMHGILIPHSWAKDQAKWYLIWFSIMGMVWLVEESLQAEELDQKPTWEKVQGVLEKPPNIYVKHWRLTWSAYLPWKVASIHEVGKVRTRSANGSISVYQCSDMGCKQHLFEITEMA